MSDVSLSRHGGVAVLTLDDGKANALRFSNLQAIMDALEEIEASDAGAVLITGRNGFFSGGLDLKTLPSLEPEALRTTLLTFSQLAVRLFAFPRPTVSAVSGHAIAGGAILALCTDLRYGVTGPYRFGINEVAIGMPMPVFLVELLREVLAPPALVPMLLHGRIVSHAEAQSWGVLSATHPLDQLQEVALKRAEELATLPTSAYATTRQRLYGAAIARAEAVMESELEAFMAFFTARR